MFCYSVSYKKLTVSFNFLLFNILLFMPEKALFCREKWAVRRSEKRQMEFQEVANEDAKGYEWQGQRL